MFVAELTETNHIKDTMASRLSALRMQIKIPCICLQVWPRCRDLFGQRSFFGDDMFFPVRNRLYNLQGDFYVRVEFLREQRQRHRLGTTELVPE